jgi:hypothetical protein
LKGLLDVKTVEYLMKTDKIEKSEAIPDHDCKKITLSCGITFIFKPRSKYHNFMREVSFYRLNRICRLPFVTPTVWREIHGMKGSAQIWVNKLAKGDDQLPNDALIPTNGERVSPMVSSQVRWITVSMLKSDLQI